MEPAAYAKIRRNPKFVELVRQRGAFARNLTIAMLAIYFGFILLVAFWPKVLGTPIGSGFTTVGVVLGLGVIVSAFVLSGLYVYRANTEFDPIVQRIIERAT